MLYRHKTPVKMKRQMMKTNSSAQRNHARFSSKAKSSTAKQSGVALIFVLLIVAVLAGLAATMTERMSRQFYRATNLIDHQQAYWYAIGVEALAKAGLEQTFEQDDETVNLNQAWAIRDRQYPLDRGVAKGSMLDAQACFNINALASVEAPDNPSDRPYLVEVLQFMLEESGADSYEAEQGADSAWEFVDSNDRVDSQSGVESSSYEGMSPAYQAPNSIMVDKSELRAVMGVSAPVMQRLMPAVCALPTSELQINVNTLMPEQAVVLQALYQPSLSLEDAQTLIEDRPYDGWGSVEEFTAEPQISGISPEIQSKAENYLSVTSQYFELDVAIMVEASRVRLRSLMYTADKEEIQVIRRRLGGIRERVSNRQTEQ